MKTAGFFIPLDPYCVVRVIVAAGLPVSAMQFPGFYARFTRGGNA